MIGRNETIVLLLFFERRQATFHILGMNEKKSESIKLMYGGEWLLKACLIERILI